MMEMWAGILTDSRSQHPPKDQVPMVMTSFGITVVRHPATNLLAAVSMMALQLLRESYTGFSLSTMMDSTDGVVENAHRPMDVTFLGIYREQGRTSIEGTRLYGPDIVGNDD